MVYIRSKAKDHGKGIKLKAEFRMVYRGGGSVLEAAEAAEREGATVLGVAAIFTYELPKGTANFADKQMTLLTLTNYSTLIDRIRRKIDVTLLQEWKKILKTGANNR